MQGNGFFHPSDIPASSGLNIFISSEPQLIPSTVMTKDIVLQIAPKDPEAETSVAIYEIKTSSADAEDEYVVDFLVFTTTPNATYRFVGARHLHY